MSDRSNLKFAMRSDTGRLRPGNEDICVVDAGLSLFIVCDGMGGAAGGEVASKLAAHVVLTEVRHNNIDNAPERTLVNAVVAANRAVLRQASEQPALRGMGTTVVALQVMEDNGTVYVVHVGDSRCYRLRDGLLTRLTRDHTYVDEQVQSGSMSATEAETSPWRNVLTRAVGTAEEIEAELQQISAMPGDVYLLCSDGLTHLIADSLVTATLVRAGDDMEAAADALVDAANLAGGDDNITVILLRLEP